MLRNWMLLMALAALALTGCGGGGDETAGGLSGAVRVDGSSTVFPITEAVGEEFQRAHRGVRVTVGISGTGGGFKKFIHGETDINDASRTIKDSEMALAAEAGVEYYELPVAFDGLSIIVNPANDWADDISIEELHKIWQPGSTVETWQDVRPSWPDRPLNLYGPDTDSGTFDYFTEAVNGASQVCRADYTASADDNVLVTGIAGDVDALGYFGYAYYEENTDKLKVLAVDGGAGPVKPTVETISTGSYAPLSRPLFIYINAEAVQREAVNAFVRFYLDNAATLAREVGYIALPPAAYEKAWQRVEQGKTGSVFHDVHARSGELSIEEILDL